MSSSHFISRLITNLLVCIIIVKIRGSECTPPRENVDYASNRGMDYAPKRGTTIRKSHDEIKLTFGLILDLAIDYY